MARFLDLDQGTPGGSELTQFGVHDVAEIEHHRPVIGVMLVPQHAGQGRRADSAELDRTVTEALGDLPQCRVFKRATGQFFFDDCRLVSLLYLPQDPAGADVVPRHPALRGAAVAVDAAEA